MVDLGNVLFTLKKSAPCSEGERGTHDEIARVCLISLGCVGGAIAFGVVANAAIDLVMPAAQVGREPGPPGRRRRLRSRLPRRRLCACLRDLGAGRDHSGPGQDHSDALSRGIGSPSWRPAILGLGAAPRPRPASAPSALAMAPDDHRLDRAASPAPSRSRPRPARRPPTTAIRSASPASTG